MEETNKNRKMEFPEGTEIRTMAKDIAKLRTMKPRERGEGPDEDRDQKAMEATIKPREDIIKLRAIEIQKEKERKKKEEALKIEKKIEEKPPIKRETSPQPSLPPTPPPPTPPPPPLTPSPSLAEKREREEEERKKQEERRMEGVMPY